jgi:hypothetical protein
MIVKPGRNFMKTKLFLITLLFTTAATAQTSFSFAGLTWGMTASAVAAHLKSSGINVSMRDRIACMVNSECWLKFDDGDTTPPKTVQGQANFNSDVLVSILIDSDLYQAPKREAKLRQTYGAPMSIDNSQCNLGPGWCNLMYWKSTSGETIEFSNNGSIRYQSGEFNKKETKERDNNANRIRF